MSIKKHWNSSNLSNSITEEFKYLDRIDSLEYEISEAKDNLSRINMYEYYNIKNNKERIKIDFGEINNKLGDISNLIKVKLGEIRGR
ncbi:hypothetical protein QTH25_13545 [Clostridium perfringens]|uniref:hypothetical protein n=1 Tax=Clostridium perfringens TaxID=1502 RepID=UPI00338F989C|nr:hypothetical protein [Clostridium perfringens]